MGRQTLRYWFLLIAGYLAVAYASGFGSDINNATSGAVNITKALQGR